MEGRRAQLRRPDPKWPASRRGTRTCLSDHAVPNAVDFLAVLPVGDEVKVVGEAHDLGQPLQDVDAEALAALFHGGHAFIIGTAEGHSG